MRKILLFFLIVLLLPNVSLAQRPIQKQHEITLNGNNIELSANFQEMKASIKAMYPVKAPAQLGWFIIQFNSIPTIGEQERLKSQGVELLDYLQGNAYFAYVSSGFLSLNTKETKNVNSLIAIKPEYKINQELASGNIPEYAKGTGDFVKVVITYFKNADVSTIAKGTSDIKMIDKKVYEKFHQIEAEVSQSDLLKLASCDWVQNIEMVAPPAELENDHGKSLHRSNVLNSKIPGLGYNLTGKGVKIGLWDADVYNHRDFNDRVTVREFESHNTDHGTHTCGTITGAGLIDPKAEGMAPEATVYSWNFNVQSNGLSVPYEMLLSLDNDGIEITSNSYGYNVTSCPNPYAYNGTDYNEDLIANWYPYYLFVFSAGNNQSVCPTGYFTTSKNMKNSLMVAAVDQMEDMSSFSSFGPTKDGRLIPNISGDGVNTYSTFFDNGYGIMSGTSMATPGVAGTMALVYQRYKETHGGQQPISSLMRALACNTATDLGNPGPDYKYGYGAINGLRAVEVMEQNTYVTDTISQGRTYTKDITVPSGAAALRVMLAWTDAPGNVGSSHILVNDLDLWVDNGLTETHAWVLDPNNPSAPAIQDYDGLNNMEQVTIDNPAAGTYTIYVDGWEIPAGVQEFAVVYDIVMPTLKLTYPIGGESLTPGNQVVVRWDCEGYDNPFALEYSIDGGVNYTLVASDVASDSRGYLWTVPADVTNNAKFRISNGSVLNENKVSFNVMPVPQNVNVASAQCDGAATFPMTWDAVTNAKYEVLKLNGQVYEHLAEVTTNSYDITGITRDKNNWYCVRAIDLTNGAISQRSLAVTVNPSEAIVALPFAEDFESQEASNFYFTSVYGQGNVRYVNDAQKYGIRLEGKSGSTSDWNDATGEDCFTNNPNYIVTASICTIDATSMAGKDFWLKFDYRQKYRTAAGTSYFRVKVNDDYLTNSEGTQIYGATNQVSYKTVYYDLAAYAGLESVKVEFEAVCKTNYTTYVNPSTGNYDFSNDNYDEGDFVTIDNVEMLEPLNDMALTSLTAGTGETATETITIQVQNLSGASVSNIPVSYTIDGGAAVNEEIAGPIAAMEAVSYDFTQTADFSVGGLYNVEASVNLPSDQVAENNTLAISKINNGADILIGTGSPTTTCDAILTDPSGRYADYANSQTKIHTIAPGTVGKQVKITFTEFATESGYDYVYVFDGPSTSSPLHGKYSGSTLPPSFTSTADGGELTIAFTSDSEVTDEGFVATLECVDKPVVEPVINPALTAITEPVSGVNLTNETVTVTVKNVGTVDLADVDVYYQIDENTPVSEVIATLNASDELNYSFTTPADLSALGAYTIKAWVEYTGDVDVTNNLVTVNITNSASVIDAGISAIATVMPARTANSKINVTIKNFGNEAISNFDIAYTINGGSEVTQTIAGPIDAGATSNVTFTTLADLSAFGTTYTINAYTKLVGDEDAGNDMTSKEVVTPTLETTNVVGSFVKGGTNSVKAGTNASIDLINNYTIECWVNLSDPASYGHIFNKTNVSLWYETNYGSAYYGTNTFILSVTKASGSLTWIVPDAVKPNTWQHVALTVSSANVYTLYIDGVAQTWTVYSGTAGATKTNANNPICIGNRPTDLARSTNGYIDEFRVWNSELSQATIQANMMTDYPADNAGLVAYYKFKEGNGNYVYDYSSNDNTAIISNADVDGMGDGKFWNTPGFLLKDLNFTDEKIPTTFDANTSTFTTIMDAADLSSLTANFTPVQESVIKVGTDVQTSGVTVNDFSGSVAYIAEGTGFNTGITQTYTVNVTNDLSSDCDLTAYTFETADNAGLASQIVLDQNGSNYYKKVTAGMNVSALKASFTASSGAKVYINNVEETSPQAAAIDYSNPVVVKVVAENGRSFKIYSIFIDARISAADLTDFGIVDEQVGTTDLNSTDHTVGIWVKNSTDLSMLSSDYTVSPKAKVYVNGITQINGITANNFTDPVVYKVVSEDESTSVDWTVTVTNDVTIPVITLIGNAEETIAHGSIYTDAGATATDNVDGDITESIVITNMVKTELVGQQTVTYNVTDAAGNDAVEVTRTVNVTDQTAPEITLLGDATVNVYLGDTYTDEGATALDNVDGDITSSIVVSNTVNTAVIGQYTVKYNVTDAAGNEAEELVRTVNVQAKLVTSIVVTGANNATTITVNAGTLQMSAEVLPSDATDNSVTWSVVNGTGDATISATGLLQAVGNGTVTVTATAKDGSGISGSLVITISNQGTYIDDVENNIFSIYPNPADDKITISTSEKWNKLIIYNSIGVVVKTTSYTQIVDVSDLPAGSYIISVANEKESFVKHFIKK